MVNDLYEWCNDKKRQWWKMPWPNLIGISGRWKIETDCQRQKKRTACIAVGNFEYSMIHEPSRGQEIIENICPPGIRTLSFAVVDNYRRAFYPNKKWHPPQKKLPQLKKWYNLFTWIACNLFLIVLWYCQCICSWLLQKCCPFFCCYDLIISNWNRLQRLMPSSLANQTSSTPTVMLELCFISFFLKRDKLTTFIWNAHRYTKTIPAKKKNKHFWLVQEIHAHNKNTTTMIYHQQQHREMGNLISKLIRQRVVGKYCEQLYIHIVHKKDNSSCHLILWNFIKITRHIYC